MGDVGNKAAEISRVTNLNIDLQKQVIEQDKVIAGLANQHLRQLTGGDSFCYVEIIPRGTTLDDVLLVQQGMNHMLDVQVRLTNIDSVNIGVAMLGQVIPGKMYPIVPLLFRGAGMSLDSYPVTVDSDYRRYNAFIMARNGIFHTLVRLNRTNGAWTKARRVTAAYYNAKQEYVVFEQIDAGFPVERLKTDEDWTSTKKLAKRTIRLK